MEMKEYHNFEIEDFLLDEYFVQWVKNPNAENNAFWKAWLIANPSKERILHEAKSLILSIKVKTFKEISSSKVESHVKVMMDEIQQIDLQEKIKGKTKRLPWANWIKIAAILTIGLGVSWLFYQQYNEKGNSAPMYESMVASSKIQLIEKINEDEKPLLVKLSDGSKITLYQNSRVSYPAKFEADKREVYLTGDAFFNIAKNPNKPFLVHAGEIVTRVLGTSFFVKAPNKETNVQVEVITGKVSVFEKNTQPNSGVVLSPNHKVTFYEGQHHFVTGLIDNPQPQIAAEQDNANIFEFHDTPLSEVLEKISMIYGIRIEVENEKLYDCPFTADIRKQPLHTQLEIICTAINGNYEIKGTVILINGQGCDSL